MAEDKYSITAEGLKKMQSWRYGLKHYQGVRILYYLRKFRTEGRTREQIFQASPYEPTRGEVTRSVKRLLREKLIKRG